MRQITPQRVAEAQSQGFNTDKIWYHGSTRRFTSFRDGKEDAINELGVGIYLTKEWYAANAWALDKGFVYQCYLRDGDIFDFSKEPTKEVLKRLHAGHSKMMDERFGPDSGYPFKDFVTKILKKQQTISSPRYPTKFIQWAGYMGAIDPHSQIPGQIVVFNPSDIYIAARGLGNEDPNG